MSEQRPDGVPESFERCRECKNWLPLDEREYIISHRYVYEDGQRRIHPVKDLTDLVRYDLDGYVCEGGKKRSLEWKERAFQKKWAKHDRTIASVIEDASIAFDALMDANRDIDRAKFIKLALDEYKKRYGSAGVNYDSKTYITARCAGGDWRNHKMDVYCVFCRGLLVSRISTAANPEAFPRVAQHAIQCALLCLSGRQEFMPPDHRSLIIEDRAFAD